MSGDTHILACRIRGRLCALPLLDVIETMPLLPIEPIANPAVGVIGIARVHGHPAPVVDLGPALGSEGDAGEGSLVAIRVAQRLVLLRVDALDGVHALPTAAFHRLPPLLDRSAGGVMGQIAEVDSVFLAVIETSRILIDGLPAADGMGPTA